MAELEFGGILDLAIAVCLLHIEDLVERRRFASANARYDLLLLLCVRGGGR